MINSVQNSLMTRVYVRNLLRHFTSEYDSNLSIGLKKKRYWTHKIVNKNSLQPSQLFIHRKKDYAGEVMAQVPNFPSRELTDFYLVRSSEEREKHFRHDFYPTQAKKFCRKFSDKNRLWRLPYDSRYFYDFVHCDDIMAYDDKVRLRSQNPRIRTIQLLGEFFKLGELSSTVFLKVFQRITYKSESLWRKWDSRFGGYSSLSRKK